MNREHIKNRIWALVLNNTNENGAFNSIKSLDLLTDLFIELSNERCKEQRDICKESFLMERSNEIASIYSLVNSIVKADTPSLH